MNSTNNKRCSWSWSTKSKDISFYSNISY